VITGAPDLPEPRSIGRNANRRALFDIADASSYLGCSERFLRRLIQERRIPFVRLGGTKIRFSPEDLDRWVDAQRVPARR
jgi:excisionase family DNA binding protein